MPFVQREPPGGAPCKHREVRRRVVGPTGCDAKAPVGPSNPPEVKRQYAVGDRLRVKWAPLEAWVSCHVLESRSFDEDGLGVHLGVQHRLLLETGEEEWVDLTEVAACEPLSGV